MKLSKKTLCYSLLIALILVLFIILYFAFMLPSLYVQYTEEENLESVIKVQKGYSKDRSYRDLEVKNPTGSVSIEIPFKGKDFYLAGKAFRLTVNLKDRELLEMIDGVRNAVYKEDDISKTDVPDIDFEKIKEKFAQEESGLLPQMFSYSIDVDEEMNAFQEQRGKLHKISHSMIVFEGGAKDDYNEYTTYFAIGKTKDALIISLLPVSTPKMQEIRPIVFGSIPMIAAVVFLLVLVASRLFSKKIVEPVIRLADYAEAIKEEGYIGVKTLQIQSKDEIGDLGRILNDLYEKLWRQYKELEEKNLALAGENKRQEIFLRASSHQLKTPITAALLLLDGMMSEIGRYKDTQKYLPEVKKQLLSMRKIVEDILYLNHFADHIKKEQTDMNLLVREVIENYRISAGEHSLSFSYEGYSVFVLTDVEIMRKILDNLISNAVSYTPKGGQITIRLSGEALEVFNEGAYIEEELLPHIYEPFVSSDTKQKGRGLGLYVISYYIEVLGLKISITNEEHGVLAHLELKENKHEKIEKAAHNLHTNCTRF